MLPIFELEAAAFGLSSRSCLNLTEVIVLQRQSCIHQSLLDDLQQRIEAANFNPFGAVEYGSG
jgi:hypothetical protein